MSSTDVFFAVLDVKSQTAAVSAVWWPAVAVTGVLVAWVCLRARKLRKQRAAGEAARRKAELRAAGLMAVPAAADEEWQRIIASLKKRDR